MGTSPQPTGGSLQDFIDLLRELRGVVEVKAIVSGEEAWIGFRTGRTRPPTVLLQQISRAAIGFGLELRSIHFGILAD